MPQPKNIRPRGSDEDYSSDTERGYDPMLDCPNNDPYSFGTCSKSRTSNVRDRDYSDYSEFGEELDESAVENWVDLLDP